MVSVVCALAATGCASKNYVLGELGTVEQRTNERLDLIKAQIEDTQRDVAAHDERIGEASDTAQEALARALAAGKLAEGKLLYERVLSGDSLKFGFDEAALSDEVQVELDQFGNELVNGNENVFIEIQGHTDASGAEEYNYKLGEKRAEAVRRYLNGEHGIPLHRMSVISYGESAPLGDNNDRDGRAVNRRVAMVVLK